MSTPKRAHFSKAFSAEIEKETPALPRGAEPETKGEEPEAEKQEKLAPAKNPRAKKVQIPVYVLPEARKQLKVLCAETGRKQEDLLREALNDFFKKHQKPTIA